ncbi:MAG: quinone-dependent dihydroorotate dehydrogenase [Rhodobacteraceae bacterium]|nr:quinone-dependent dihydroorotate dehydrogenase [Paracoccaceae bacterium]
MKLMERIGLTVLHKFDPENAHKLALVAMKMGVVPLSGVVTSDRLKTTICGLELPNPVGLAAGYDKNCEVVDELSRAGFGFVECGAVTPKAQEGNPRPRLFRLTRDQAVINRYGFNNKGMDAAAANLARRLNRHKVPVGLNLGAGKDSADRPGDFAKVLATCGKHIEFASINVSSPNTEALRDLQGEAALREVIERVIAVRDGLNKYLPVFVKIAPDLNLEELTGIARAAQKSGADGIIATNTTLEREGLKSASAGEAGGLSGAPLFEMSTRVLAQLSEITGGKVPLIGVGGIGSAEQAYAKIRAGAHAVQVYSALVYQGLSLVEEIALGLDKLLERDGFEHVSEAVGTGRNEWL